MNSLLQDMESQYLIDYIIFSDADEVLKDFLRLDKKVQRELIEESENVIEIYEKAIETFKKHFKPLLTKKESTMNYKAVICDLDGTLLNDEHRLSDYTKEVIQKIIAKGIKLFIATGRHHIDAGEIRGQLGLDTTLITSNGARVHDEAGEEILAYDLSEEIAKGILDLERDDEIHINLYQGDHWLVERENKALHEYHKESGFQYKIIPFHTLDSYKLTKIYYTCEDHEKLVALQEKIENLFPERLNVTFSNPNCLEVMAKGVSKGMAISKVLEQHSIHPREAMAFGDGLNDLEMLQVVGKGLIMGNAHDKLKEALSEHEVIQSNDKDGVAKYLEKLL